MKGAEDLIYSAVATIAAEGRIDERELEFLETLRKHLGVSEEFVRTAVAEAKRGQRKVRLPTAPRERRRMLGVMVKAAAANGEIAPEERRLLAIIAQKTGISIEDLDIAIERALQAVSAVAGGAPAAGDSPESEEPEPEPEPEPEEEGQPEGQASASPVEVTNGFKCMHCGGAFARQDALHNGVPVARGTITKVFCPHCKKHVLTSPSVSTEWTVVRLELIGNEKMPGREVFGKVDTTLE